MIDKNFYKNKRVLVTGHTGFKGSWMCTVLSFLGAKVTGYALAPIGPNLFEACGVSHEMNSVIGDVRDLEQVKKVFRETQPELVIHMAAQPLVRESYINPAYTYEVNVMGTVNVLECIRETSSVRSFINVTTDKVYKNKEWEWGYREDEELNGYDPYSNSKSCSELVTSTYINSFFQERQIAISTMRAGNVIGGGDFAKDRIIPDCVRAAYGKKEIEVRNPYSIRPYQHVLDAVMAYLMVAQEQYIETRYAGNYNVGPNNEDSVETGEIVSLFCDAWASFTEERIQWTACGEQGLHEANFLKLDCSRLKKTFHWNPVWDIKKAVEKTVEWAVVYQDGGDILGCMEKQMCSFEGNIKRNEPLHLVAD